MTIDFYYTVGSPPCRLVVLTAKALNLDLNFKQVDFNKGEHKTAEFLKINPQHTIPTIVDDGFALAESRAIITYLVNKYGKGSTLYPEEPQARALVDQRLYFDAATLYPNFVNYFFPRLFAGAPDDKAKRAKIEEAFDILNNILEGVEYSAGSNLTLADFSLVVSVSCVEAIDIDFNKYDNIKRWYETVKTEAPGYHDVSKEYVDILKIFSKKLQEKE